MPVIPALRRGGREKTRREGKEREEEKLTEPKKKIKQGWRERANSCFCH